MSNNFSKKGNSRIHAVTQDPGKESEERCACDKYKNIAKLKKYFLLYSGMFGSANRATGMFRNRIEYLVP